MYVFNYLELHTVLIGWILYDLLWAALAETGIIALPFIWILFKNWRQSSVQGNSMDRSTHNDAKALIWDLIIAFLILLFVAMPLITLQPSTIKYQPVATFTEPTPSLVTAASDPTTYNNDLGTLSAGNTAKIPLWWRGIIGISSGVTNALIQNLPTPGDLREAQAQLTSNNITNPNLAHEYRSFVANCYIPAKNRLEERVTNGSIDASAVNATDIDWPGSSYLTTMAGGYAACSNPDTCGSTLRPNEVRALGANSTCANWWELLEADIYAEDSANDGLWQNMLDSVTLLSTFSTDAVRDTRVRNLLNNMNATNLIDEYNYGETSNVAFIGNQVQDAVSTVAIGWSTLNRSGFINVMNQAVPIMMAIITLVLYFMMPAALVFTAFSIEAVIALTFIVFSLIITHAFFAVASWLDYYLITSIFDDFGLLGWLGADAHGLGTIQKRWLLNIIVGTLYIGLPTLWLYVMMVAGVGAAGGAARLMNAGSTGHGSMGNKNSGAGNAANVANRARTRFKK